MNAPPHRPLPADFLFGVATAGFQIEGGYNGRDEPRNNWFRLEAEGRVEPSGLALDFWNDYEAQLDRAVAAGCNAFRFSLEWARCEPADGEIDDEAFARYADIVDACRERGLEPLVTLHHFTHPWWAGEDFWLRDDAPERFARWAAVAAARIAVRHWVTINEYNILAVQSWVTGDFPPARSGDVRAAVRAIDHLLAAHVLAHTEIHAAIPDAVVATNGFAFSLYELDRLGTDVLLARRRGVPRRELRTWLAGRRARYEAALPRERVLRALLRKVTDLDATLARTVEAVYASPHECSLDHVQTDYYNPDTTSHFRVPGHMSSGGRHWGPDRLLWDDPPDPERFARYLPLLAEDDLDLWVVENGLCNRMHNGRSYARLDGWDRPRYLQAHLRTLVAAHAAGLHIGAYFHWTLADNYEWGSYEPCFGLYAVDRARGVRWSDRDAMGHHAARAYRRLVEGLLAGDRSVLSCPVDELER
jgi:beta-glucosidase/6-phospho-beta-glucosidase/beta-galactosidase